MIDKRRVFPRRGGGYQSGHSLVASLVFILVLTVFGFSFLKFGAYEADSVQNRFEDMKIFWKGEEALSEAMARMNRTSKPENLRFLSRDTEYPHGRNYAADVRALAMEGAGSGKYRSYRLFVSVRDAGSKSEERLALEAVLEAKTTADFWNVEDHPGASFYFTGDTIDGDMHTNTRFAIAGNPVFLSSKFESGHGEPMNGFLRASGYPGNPVIIGTKPEWGARVFDFKHFSQEIRMLKNPYILHPLPQQVAEITFTGSSYSLRYRDKANPGGYSQAIKYPLPKSGGLFVNGEVEVRGVLQGAITIGSAGNIVITGDLVYAGSDPVTGRPDEGSASVLGLISEKNVQILPDYSLQSLGKGIRINAGIVAMDKSFELLDAKKVKVDLGPMHFWGAIAQWERGSVGGLRKGKLEGFTKKWHFDRRFAKKGPAYFPPLIDQKGRMEFKPVYWNADHV